MKTSTLQLIFCSMMINGCVSQHDAPANLGAPTPVGGKACTGCHEPEASSWTNSHHDFAMMGATGGSVLGDFDESSFSYNGVTTTFFRKDGGFWVRTDGPDGQLADYEIHYTFGVTPLQQYLIGFPGGRLQSLGIAWVFTPGQQRWPALVSPVSRGRYLV